MNVRRERRPRWLAVAGARPNFVKVGPLVAAARRRGIALPWVHTGQHYDVALSAAFVRDLRLPPPCASLDVGSGSHAETIARVLLRLERVLALRRPDVLVVVGDVDSTLGAALAGVARGIPVAHVESGLRSFDESMPEERNRVLVDHVSAVCYVTEPSGVENLAREGVPSHRVRLVGNPMIDALAAAADEIARRAPKEPCGALVTLHRPANVDEPSRLRAWVAALVETARRVPVLFPAHPRTMNGLRATRSLARLAAAGVRVAPPMGYLDFVAHLSTARVVATDSGGVQEEASYFGVPCLTLRDSTERPLTVEKGSNRLVGDDPRRLASAVARAVAMRVRRPYRGRFADGRASDRIVADLLARFSGGRRSS